MSKPKITFDDCLKRMEEAGIEEITSQESNHVALSRELARELIAEMSTDEKIHMLSGHWNTLNGMLHGRVYNYDPIDGGGCKRLGIPPIKFTDGPRGVVMGKSSAFPTSNVRAAAFDTSLETRFGEAVAKELMAQGANYFAGVCINLLRHPSWGRAQEAYGEDQYLTGRYGAALTRALQKHGVIACPKHYYMNSIENLRFSVSADADEETLRDVYLYHFEDCFDAGAGSVMSAYNKVNGTYCGESKEVFDHLKLFGFNGFSISDFVWGVHDGPESLKAGLDIEMPMTMKRGRSLKRALKKGDISLELIEQHCENIISTLLRFQVIYRKEHYDKSVISCKDHVKLAREIEEKGAVLLRNDGTLPIRDSKTRIALIGRFAEDKVIGDHGSSCCYPDRILTPAEAFAKEYDQVDVISSNDPALCLPACQAANQILLVVGNNFEDEGEFIANANPKLIKGGDRKSLRLHADEVQLIEKVSQLGKPVTVIFYSGSAVITEEWADKVNAIIYAGYAGMVGAHALARIVKGEVNPSGKLPFTVARREEDYPFFPYGSEKDQRVNYDYYHGYALFEKEGIQPEYPFGFGLSYTTFDYANPFAVRTETGIKVTVDVTNTGSVAGDEAVLIFAGSGIQGKPHKLLKGFTRVSLTPGETAKAEVEIPYRDLRLYDKDTQNMIIPEDVTIYVGKNVAEAEERFVRV